MALIDIKYNIDEKNNVIYESVNLETLGIKPIIFKTNNFIKDWFNVIKFYIKNYSDNQRVSYLSSVNDFIVKSNNYKSVFLIIDENDQPKLLYDNSFLEKDKIKNKIELFIEKEQNFNWKELKKYCE